MRILALLLSLLSSAMPAVGDTPLTAAESKIAKEIGFDASLLAGIKAKGETFERLIGQTYEDEAVPSEGMVLLTRPGKGRSRLDRLREALRGTGYYAWFNEDLFGSGPDKIAVMRGSDDLRYLATVYVSAPNFSITHEQVVERYLQWRDRLGLQLIGGNQDWLSARITKPPEDWAAFAGEVYEFCPDVVDQGTLTVGKLATEMKAHNELFLWWD